MKLHKKLKFIRKSLELNQKQLARILDVTPAALCRWESAKRLPEGGNRQLLNILYVNVKAKKPQELERIRVELAKLLKRISPLGCLNTLLHDLFQD